MKSSRSHALLSSATLFALLISWIGASGCRADPSSPKEKGEKPMRIQINSSAFAEGQPIPKKHTGEGQDVSPQLQWSQAPEGTKELAIICDDPERGKQRALGYRLIYKIPANRKGLPEGIAKQPRLTDPPGAMQGLNSWPKGENWAIAARCLRPATARTIIISSSMP